VTGLFSWKRDFAKESDVITFLILYTERRPGLSQRIRCLAFGPCTKHRGGVCYERLGVAFVFCDLDEDDEISGRETKALLRRHSPSEWKPGKEYYLFENSPPSEVCRVRSVYVC